MRDIVREYQTRFRQEHQRARRYTALLLALALTTSLFVNWQLHGVGIAKTADYQCGLEEHTHTAECYPEKLICGYTEGQPEDGSGSDDASGMDADGSYSLATYSFEAPAAPAEPEFIYVPHEHTEDCYQEVRTLTCWEDEHEHTDDCFDPEDNSLICGIIPHTHDDSCYDITYELVCGLEESELVEEPNPNYVAPDEDAFSVFEGALLLPPVVTGTEDNMQNVTLHHHTDACWAPDYDAEPICGLKEHHHTVNCLSDPLVDAQDEDDWLARSGVSLTGLWNDDLLAVAQAELGYQQSEKSFKLDTDDGETLRYYTRYGAWYGNAYGPWDVAFLSYCLNHAGISQSVIPQYASVLSLRSSLKSNPLSELYAGDFSDEMSVSDILPGDIVIYNGTTTRDVVLGGDPLPDVDTGSGSSVDTGIALLPLEPGLPVQTGTGDGTSAGEGAAASGPETAESSIDTAPEIQEQTVVAETVGIVSSVDEASGTLTVISGNVDGRVAEVTLSTTDITTLISVASAQAVAAGGMDTLDSSDTVAPDLQQMLDGSPYVTDFRIQKLQSSDYTDINESLTTDKLHGFIELTEIPVDSIKSNNNMVYVKIPAGLDQLQNDNKEKGDITDNTYTNPVNGSHVCGSYEFVEIDGTWYVLFTYNNAYLTQQESNRNSQVKTDVSFDFQWDSEKIKTDQSNSFVINGTEITITIKEDNEDKPADQKKYTLSKSGTSLRYSGHDAYIDYTVKLTLKAAMSAPLTLEDVLTSPNSIFKFDGDPSVASTDGASATTVSWTGDTTKTITLGQANETLEAGVYTITYTVKAENFGSADYQYNDKVNNSITFNGTAKTEETFLSTKVIDKSGNVKNGDITWTVKINTGDSLRYLPEGSTFTDTLPDAPIDGKITVKMDGGKKDTIDLSKYYDTDSRTLTYPLTEGFHSYEITYKTKAPANTSESGIVVKNTGNVDGDGISGSKEAEVTIPSTKLSKTLTAGTHDTGTATMDWTTTINAEDLSALIYYDWSSTYWDAANGTAVKWQSIVPDSVHVYDAAQNEVTGSVTIDYDYQRDDRGINVGLFSIDFRSCGITGPVTIQYQTKADLIGLASGDSCQIINHGQLNEGDIVSAEYRFNNTAEQRKYFRKFAGDSSSWNKTEGTITLKPGQTIPWTIAINDTTDEGLAWDAVKDKVWIVRDTIPAGLNLDESSVQVELNGNIVPGSSYEVSAEKQTDGTTKLVVTLQPECYTLTNNGDKTISKRVFIRYNTTLDPDNAAVWNGNTASFVNSASFERNGEESGSDSFTETVTRDVVGKRGSYDEATGLLTYQVQVNPYGSTLNGGTELNLHDYMKIQSGPKERVSLAGISVFDGELQADGSLEASALLYDLTPITGDYDTNTAPGAVNTDTYYTNRNSDGTEIHVWTKVPDNTPLVLVFHYTIDTINLPSKTTYKFKNTVKLDGFASRTDESVQFTSDSSAHAGIDFNTNTLTIVKYSGNQSHLLAAARFRLEALQDGQWETVQDGIVTSAGGNAVMEDLTTDTLYRLKETNAPAGYLLPDPNGYHYFVISSAAGSELLDSLTLAPGDTRQLYQLAADDAHGSFYFYCNNARNPDYITPGSLKVTKLWQDVSGNAITDTAALPSVRVTLTKHAQKATVTFKGTVDSTVSYKLPKGQTLRINGWTAQDFSLAEGAPAVLTYQNGNVDLSNIQGDVTVNVSWNDFSSSSFNISYEGDADPSGFVTEVGTATLDSSNDWAYTWKDLDCGDADDPITYTVKEVTSLGDEYTTHYQVNSSALTDDVPALALSTEGASVKIINQSTRADVYELPSTGGAGTTLYTAGGIALMLSALVCGACRKRRRERRAHN